MDALFSLLKLLLLTVVGLTLNKMLAFGHAGVEEPKCKYSRVDRLLRIRCCQMNLKEVPTYLKTSVEILDLSFNRIRKLHRKSFQNYGSIKYLLLYENMIQSVEPDTFSHLTSMQEIDLSNNALTTIPLELFQLKSLRNLYVDSNDLMNLEMNLKKLITPIEAPLEYLNIANCELKNLPNLGILPKLWHINASSNPLSEITMDRFAYMCHLKDVDLMKTKMSACQCLQINNHLRMLGANAKYVPVCLETLDLNQCPLPYNQTIDTNTFESCKTSIQRAEARSMWLFVAGCLGGILTVLFFAWFCMCRLRKRRQKKQKMASLRKKPSVVAPKNALNRNNSSSELCHQTSNHNFLLTDEAHQTKELLNCDSH